MYTEPFRILILLFIVVLIEILFNKGKLQFSLYVIFFVLVIRPIILGLNTFNGPNNNWIEICNYADYINYNWNRPYYPKKFWLSFMDMRSNLKEFPELSLKEQEHIKNVIQNWQIIAKKMQHRDHHIFKRLITTRKLLFIIVYA